jgi:D-alanyl-D-alanine dipeptidase
VRARSGRQLPMGTRFDSFSPRAHTYNATGDVLRNRLALVRAMAAHGFANYRREWWHFEHRVAGSRYLDLSLGCEN